MTKSARVKFSFTVISARFILSVSNGRTSNMAVTGLSAIYKYRINLGLARPSRTKLWLGGINDASLTRPLNRLDSLKYPLWLLFLLQNIFKEWSLRLRYKFAFCYSIFLIFQAMDEWWRIYFCDKLHLWKNSIIHRFLFLIGFYYP